MTHQWCVIPVRLRLKNTLCANRRKSNQTGLWRVGVLWIWGGRPRVCSASALESIAAVPDPGHFGAAMLFGPTVCLKCTAAHSTPAHRCFVSPWCENRWSLPNTPPGYWALCTLLSCDSAPFLSCGKFPSGVRQGPVIDSHLSGPCPRGPCGAGGLLDLPLVPMAGRGQLVPPPLAGRAVAVFFNSQPLTTIPSFSNWRRPRRLASCRTRSKSGAPCSSLEFLLSTAV